MSSTFTQIYIHIVFTVQDRLCLIGDSWRDELFKYITGIIIHHNHKLLAINGVADHVHILITMKPHQALSSLMQEIKANSSAWINKKELVRGRFSWQDGYGAFSYSNSQVDNVIKYIMNQQEHHRIKTFREEYLKLLELFKVKYDEKYVFKWIE